MLSTQGFVDLRVVPHGQGSHSDDSVWPSFTDIMTVVVMIFLMSLVVILIRNVDLFNQLRATMEAERESAALAESAAVKSVELAERLDELERNIADLQLRLRVTIQERDRTTSALSASTNALSASSENARGLMADIVALESLRDRLLAENEDLAKTKLLLSGRLGAVETDRDTLAADRARLEAEMATLTAEKQVRDEQVEALESERESMLVNLLALESQQKLLAQEKIEVENQRDRLRAQKASLSNEFDALRSVYALLQNDNKTLQERYEAARSAMDALERDYAEVEQKYAQTEQKLEVEQKRVVVGAQRLQSLQTNYEELESKYLKLVGPARSELNKYVAEVRYRRGPDGYTYEIREPGEDTYRGVTLPELYGILSDLKKRNPDELYTKIIIPDDSGLSYTEAWRFTKDILSRFDYYYQ